VTKATPAISEYVDLYGAIPYAEYQRHINSYIFASKFVPNKVVLDVACGSGTGSTYLAGRGARMVVGADISQHALRDAKRWNKGKQRVEFMLSDAEALPFADNCFFTLFSGDRMSSLLYRLYRFVSPEPRVARFRQATDETADTSYEVISIRDRLYKSPRALVAVAQVEH